jgi:cell shape-determining protein MreC
MQINIDDNCNKTIESLKKEIQKHLITLESRQELIKSLDKENRRLNSLIELRHEQSKEKSVKRMLLVENISIVITGIFILFCLGVLVKYLFSLIIN